MRSKFVRFRTFCTKIEKIRKWSFASEARDTYIWSVANPKWRDLLKWSWRGFFVQGATSMSILLFFLSRGCFSSWGIDLTGINLARCSVRILVRGFKSKVCSVGVRAPCINQTESLASVVWRQLKETRLVQEIRQNFSWEIVIRQKIAQKAKRDVRFQDTSSFQLFLFCGWVSDFPANHNFKKKKKKNIKCFFWKLSAGNHWLGLFRVFFPWVTVTVVHRETPEWRWYFYILVDERYLSQVAHVGGRDNRCWKMSTSNRLLIRAQTLELANAHVLSRLPIMHQASVFLRNPHFELIFDVIQFLRGNKQQRKLLIQMQRTHPAQWPFPPQRLGEEEISFREWVATRQTVCSGIKKSEICGQTSKCFPDLLLLFHGNFRRSRHSNTFWLHLWQQLELPQVFSAMVSASHKFVSRSYADLLIHFRHLFIPLFFLNLNRGIFQRELPNRCSDRGGRTTLRG